MLLYIVMVIRVQAWVRHSEGANRAPEEHLQGAQEDGKGRRSSTERGVDCTATTEEALL